MIPVKNKRPDDWSPRYVSNWIMLKSRSYTQFDEAAINGYPATRIHAACKNTELDWIALVAVASVRTDYFRHAAMDAFACGLGGLFGDQLINACTAWAKVENVEDLKLSQAEISQVEQIHALLVGHCRRSADAAMDQPIPAPIPKPVPPPPKPAPPVVVEPAPVASPVVEPVGKPGWKKTAATIAGVIGGTMFLAKLFAPAAVVVVLEFLHRILLMIGG